jgi:CheY-like chemotaxis protein
MSESAIRQAIIVVEDDREDRQLIEEAAAKAGISLPMICLENGEQLINLLFHPEASGDRQADFQPLLIMLDLNLPLAGGKRVLEMLKQKYRW